MNHNTLIRMAELLAIMNKIIKVKNPLVQLLISKSQFYGLKKALLRYLDIQKMVSPVAIESNGDEKYIVLKVGNYFFHQHYDPYWQKFQDLPERGLSSPAPGEFVFPLETVMETAIRDLRLILLQYDYILSNRKLDIKDFKFIFKFMYPNVEYVGSGSQTHHKVTLKYGNTVVEYGRQDFRKRWRQYLYKLYQTEQNKISVN